MANVSRLGLLIGLLGTAACPAAALAEPTAIVSVGNWTASEDNGSFAEVATQATGVAAFILPAGSHHFLLRLANQSWDFPPRTAKPVTISFDSGTRFDLAGFGQGHVIEAALPNEEVKLWTHNFTAFSIMTISIVGDSAQPWDVSLAGSTPTVEAMSHAIALAGIADLPPPWNAVEPASVPSPAAASLPPVIKISHPDCVPHGLVVVNGYYSMNAAAEQQRVCEQGYAERAEQQRLTEIANLQAAQAAEARVRAAQQAEQDAELSPDNHCHDPAVAGALISEFNDFDAHKNQNIKAVDIERLTTGRWDPSLRVVSCHGLFVLTDGRRLAGTLSSKPNVAGDMISNWQLD